MKKRPSNGACEQAKALRLENEVLENPDGVQTVIAQYLRRHHPYPNPPP